MLRWRWERRLSHASVDAATARRLVGSFFELRDDDLVDSLLGDLNHHGSVVRTARNYDERRLSTGTNETVFTFTFDALSYQHAATITNALTLALFNEPSVDGLTQIAPRDYEDDGLLVSYTYLLDGTMRVDATVVYANYDWERSHIVLNNETLRSAFYDIQTMLRETYSETRVRNLVVLGATPIYGREEYENPDD